MENTIVNSINPTSAASLTEGKPFTFFNRRKKKEKIMNMYGINCYEKLVPRAG